MDAVDDASQPLDYNALFTFWSLSVIFLRQFDSQYDSPRLQVPSLRYCTRLRLHVLYSLEISIR